VPGPGDVWSARSHVQLPYALKFRFEKCPMMNVWLTLFRVLLARLCDDDLFGRASLRTSFSRSAKVSMKNRGVMFEYRRYLARQPHRG